MWTVPRRPLRAARHRESGFAGGRRGLILAPIKGKEVQIMKIQYGLISCDSHAQLDKDTWTSRMSKAKWGDKIPQLRETTDKEHMIRATDKPVERWFVNGKVVGERGAVNCPTVMSDPLRKTFP